MAGGMHDTRQALLVGADARLIDTAAVTCLAPEFKPESDGTRQRRGDRENGKDTLALAALSRFFGGNAVIVHANSPFDGWHISIVPGLQCAGGLDGPIGAWQRTVKATGRQSGPHRKKGN